MSALDLLEARRRHFMGQGLGSCEADEMVGKEIGYARTTIALVRAGKYRGKTDIVEKRLLAAYHDQHLCPHSEEEISTEACLENRAAHLPTSDPDALKLWFSCQSCRHHRQA